jgi:hypothetical protein
VNVSGTAKVGTSARANLQVEHGVNDARMTAIALIIGVAVSVGLTVGYGESSVALGITSTVVTMGLMAVVVALIYRVTGVRTTVMEVMHRLTGQ